MNPGDRIGRMTLLESFKNADGKIAWMILCACGDTFVRENRRLRVHADCCKACANREVHRRVALGKRATKHRKDKEPLPCELCGDLPHRVEGPVCDGCELAYRPEPPVQAIECLRSSAGRWESAA